MAKLELLCIHCTATPEGREVFPADIRKWHLDPVEKGGRGWKQVGYSDMIMLGGTLVGLVKYNEDENVDAWEITNGAKGINSIARHVVYVGGCDKNMKPKDTLNVEQSSTLEEYVKRVIKLHPDIKVCGHYHFAPKACPAFDVEEWLITIGVNKKNIYAK